MYGTLSAGGNYNMVLSATPVAFDITPDTLTITVTAAAITYTGVPYAGATCAALEVNGEHPPATGETVDGTVNVGGSSLTYDSLSDQYIHVWKTQKSWAGSCRILVVRLSDGTDKIAKFQFTK